MHSRTLSNPHDLTPTTELPASAPETPMGSRRRPPTAMRRPAMYLAVAAAGALMVNVLWAGEPPARAAQMQSVSIAKQLGVSAMPTTSVRPLEQLVADRSQRLLGPSPPPTVPSAPSGPRRLPPRQPRPGPRPRRPPPRRQRPRPPRWLRQRPAAAPRLPLRRPPRPVAPTRAMRCP